MNGPAPFGPYLLDRRVGAGGMAEVFAARRVHAAGLEQRLVIKRLLPRFADRPEQVAMFLDEVRVSSVLCHPNIAQVHDFGEVDGAWFLALEQVDGPDLRTLLRALAEEGEPLPVQLALYIVHEVLAALEHAHVAHLDGRPLGIVHRDVCPANVMVSRQGRVKLVDFGVACSALGDSTRGAVQGHVAYMSPEQLSGRLVDPRSDLFSVGVMLHELLTGRRLFRGEDAAASARLVLGRPIAPPSDLAAQAPPELDALVLRALARDPAARFPDAQGFRRALREHIDIRVIDDCPDTLAAILRRLDGALVGASTASLAPVCASPPARTVQVRPGARGGPDVEPTVSLSAPSSSSRPLWLAAGSAALALCLAVGAAWTLAPRPAVLAPVALAPAAVAPAAVAPAAVAPVPLPVHPRSASPASSRSPGRSAPPLAAPALAEAPFAEAPVVAPALAEAPVAAPALAAPESAAPHLAEPATPPPPSAASPVVAFTPGTVSVAISPGWARVSVDGRPLKGSTPFRSLELSPGPHTLRFEHPPTGRVYVRQIEVQAGQHQHVQVQAL